MNVHISLCGRRFAAASTHLLAAVGIELVKSPRVLFMDEPTSGEKAWAGYPQRERQYEEKGRKQSAFFPAPVVGSTCRVLPQQVGRPFGN